MFAIVDSQEDEYCDYSDVLRVATKIKEEIKAITPNKSHYTPVTKENLNLSCVKTLQILLNGISPKFNDSLPASMVGNIV